jgi:predicted AAA+ superfamily ATPase
MQIMLEEIILLSQELIKINERPYRRFFIQKTQLSERLAILIGQRGVGKTTILVQCLLDYANGDRLNPKILYVQSDHLLLGRKRLYEIAREFQLMGGELIVFDEIHKYPGWSMELKSIYDTFPRLRVIASGSSALEITKGSHDLSRRALVYHIPGLSLREYLELTFNVQFPILELDEILTKHANISESILQMMTHLNARVLPQFHDYLRHGYYPYWSELKDDIKFRMTLEQNVHTTLEADLPAIYPQLTAYSIQKVEQLFIFISENAPFTPNFHELKMILEIGDERTLKTYFKYLMDAELIFIMQSASKKLSKIQKKGKMYLQNPNIIYALAPTTSNIGTIREIFFKNMLSQNYKLTLPQEGDFLINDRWHFEVGGEKKNIKQIYHKDNSYLACDGIESGINRRIPLWLFGFCY